MPTPRHTPHLVAGLLLLGLTLGAESPVRAAEPERTSERSITVSAQGSVTAEPDIAYLSAGVMSEAETTKDALAKILAGASLVQLYTGLVYEGPCLLQRIKRHLAGELQRRGARSLADLRGLEAERWASVRG